MLHRVEPEQGIRRFYSLMIERDLFGTVRLVRNVRIRGGPRDQASRVDGILANVGAGLRGDFL